MNNHQDHVTQTLALTSAGNEILANDATIEQRKAYAELVESRKHNNIVKRSTYTLKNAAKFKIYFDLAILKDQNVVIPADIFRGQPNTLYKKVCDALLYLRNKLTPEQAIPYHLLRAKTRIDIHEENGKYKGIIIKFVNVEGSRITVQTSDGQLKHDIAVQVTNDANIVAPVGNIEIVSDLERKIELHLQDGSGMFTENRVLLDEPARVRILAMLEKHGIKPPMCKVEHQLVRFYKREEKK